MSVDLERDLRTYVAYLDEVLPTITAAEVADATPTGVLSRPPRRRRGWVVALGAAAVVLVVVGGLALLTRSGDSGTGVGGVDNDDVIVPLGPVEPILGQWVMVPGGEAFTPIDLSSAEGSLVDGIAAGENGLVAVGVEKLGPSTGGTTPTLVGVVSVDQNELPAVWTSVDGTSWNRLPLDPDVFGTNGRLGYVVAGGPGYVISGDVDGASGMWTSKDGTTWTRVAAPAEAGPVTGLTGTGELVIAEGFVIGGDLNNTGIWTSTDGATWTHIADVASGGNPIVAAGPAVVVLGQTCEWVDRDQGISSCEPTVWTSPEGEEWERHDPEGDGPWDDDGPVADLRVAWFGDQLLAVAGGSGAWTSPDGVTWATVPSAAEVFSGFVAVDVEGGEILSEADVSDMAASGDRLVAVGRARTNEGEVASIWTTTDGTDWTRVPYDPALFGPVGDTSGLRHVTVTSQGFVAMGGFTTFWVWLEPAS